MIPKFRELKLKELQQGDKIFFKAIDDTLGGGNLGRAEFMICPIWKRGKLIEFYIYHRQQHNVEYYYRVKCGYSDSFSVDAWTHKGINKPEPWLFIWCKEHKCQSMSVYVPDRSNCFVVNVGSTSGITFSREASPEALRKKTYRRNHERLEKYENMLCL